MTKLTHIVLPCNLVRPRTGSDGAFEVDVVPLLDVGGVQRGAQGQGCRRGICEIILDMNYVKMNVSQKKPLSGMPNRAWN